MIRFNCTSCGKRIKVPEQYVGKKGKCPKCRTAVVVPQPEVDTTPPAERKNESIFQDPPETPELKFKQKPAAESKSEASSEYDPGIIDPYFYKSRTEEKPPERKLPWAVDIFLYPVSTSGLINLAIYWLLPIILTFMYIIPFFGILCWIGSVILYIYMYYFFTECIRDSAEGGIRAPENMADQPTVGEAFMQFLKIIAALVVFWGPACFYLIYNKTQAVTNNSSYQVGDDTTFWALLGFGIFFFPIGLLAMVILDSAMAFNPFVWITAILKTFFHYCGLVLAVSALVCLFFLLQMSPGFALLSGGLFIYSAMVVSHLLGRFYYINSRNLNWEA